MLWHEKIVLTWDSSLLIVRHQTVVVNGVKSSSAQVLNGIPQGSVLGLILFIIYISDLPEIINSDLYRFADDTKVLGQIANHQDSYELQHDQDEIQRWSKNWLLSFDPFRCKGAFENIMYAHCYIISGHELEHIDYERDLGITLDSALKFEHILKKFELANSMMGHI